MNKFHRWFQQLNCSPLWDCRATRGAPTWRCYNADFNFLCKVVAWDEHQAAQCARQAGYNALWFKKENLR